MSTRPTLQEKISAAAAQYGSNSAQLRQAVELLIAQDREQQQRFGMSSYTPQPSTSTLPPQMATPQTSSRGRTIRPPRTHGTPVPVATPRPLPAQASQLSRGSSLNPNAAYRPPTKIPLSSSAAPVPPLSRIAEPRYQAQYTTYPARMRLGTSSLMQPNYLAANGTGTNNPGGAVNKRSRTAINYAELEGLEDSDDDGNDSEAKARKAIYGGMVPKRVLGLQGGGGGDKSVWGDGKSYLGVLPPGNLVVVQPAKVTKHVAVSEDQMEEQAAEASVLVPIQIDIDVDTFKIRDAFVWNINEKFITPEAFAKIFCDDLDIPASYVAEITRQITEQCEEQTGVAEVAVRGEEEEQQDIEKDLRVVLNLDVQIGTLHLVDRVEWDLSSPLTPELFATLLVRDLSLSSSASPLIAHAIHEELFRHKKNCLEMGLVGEDVDEVSGRKRGAKALEGVWRDWTETTSFGPRVEILSLDEMDRVEADRERAIRRAKRDRLTGSRTGGRRR